MIPAGEFNANLSVKREEYGIVFGLNYELGCRRNKDQLLTASYNYSSAPTRQQDLNDVTQILGPVPANLLQSNKTGAKEQTFQLDYVYPVKSVNIEGGAKLIHRNNDAAYTSGYFDPTSGKFAQDSSSSNTFNYLQDIYGFYNSYLIKTGKWGISGGIRLERTVIHADFETSDTSLGQQYNNLIPSLSVQRNINGISNLTIGYTQRIQRPSIWQLNPFVNKSDPAFYVAGNPDLKAVVNHNLSAGYSWFKKGFLHIELDYSFATNTIQRVTTVKADSISLASYQNVGSNKLVSAALNVNYPISKALSFSLNGLVSYIWIEGMVDDQSYKNKGLQGNAYCYFMWRLKNNWRAAVNGGFFSPTVLLQGSSSGFFYSSLRVIRSLLNNKLTISASVTNPYQQYRVLNNKLETRELIQDYSYDKVSRTFSIGLNYNFGKLREQLKKNKHGIQNDDISTKKNNTEKGGQ